MAPKQSAKGAKRAAPKKEVQAPAAKKPKLPRDIQALCDVVAAADLPEGCRAMVLAGMPSSLMTTADERHDVQTTIVDIVCEIVHSTGSHIQAKVDEAREQTVDCKGKKTTLEEAVAHARRLKDEVDAELVTLKGAAESMRASADDAASQLTEAIAACEASSKATSLAKADADLLKHATDEDLPRLTCGTLELPPDEEGVNSKVRPLLRLVDLDKSLVIALPSACAKQPTNRGAFDNMVIKQLLETVREKSKELAEKVASAQDEEAEKASGVEAAQKAKAEANERSDAACRAVEATSERLREMEAGVVAALTELRDHSPKVKDAVEQLEHHEAELQNFTHYTMEVLKDRRDAKTETSPEEASSKVSASGNENVEAALPKVIEDIVDAAPLSMGTVGGA